MRRFALLLAAPLWACSQSVPPADQPVDGVARSPASTPDRVPQATTAPEPQAPTTTTASAAKLAVDGEGLRLVDPESGRTTPLAFGMDEAQVMTILERLRGPAARGTNGECGVGPLGTATWPDGLTLLIKGGKFVGWSVDARSQGRITNMAGIGPGSSRADLSDALSATFMTTTLGTEFQAGSLGGLLDGPDETSNITYMWAGTTCLFR